MEVHLYTDGNTAPGPCLGFVIRNKDGSILRTGGLKLAKGSTNNVCEYSGVITGLYNCLAMGATIVRVHCDSQLIVKQIQGQWACREKHLREYRDEVRLMMKDFERVTFQWIPRKQNAHADAAARAAWV